MASKRPLNLQGKEGETATAFAIRCIAAEAWREGNAAPRSALNPYENTSTE